MIATQAGTLLLLGLYRGLWRYTSISDLRTVLRAVGGAWVATMLVLFIAYRLEGFSRGVLIMDGILLVVGIAGSRVSLRLIRSQLVRFQPRPGAKRALIYGAGDGGELLVRQLFGDQEIGVIPVGFLDDDRNKKGRVIHGVRVLGTLDTLEQVVRDEDVHEVLISTRKIDPVRAAELEGVASAAGLRIRRMTVVLQ